MTLAIYPNAVRGLNWPVLKTMEFDTTVQKASSGQSVEISNATMPLWNYSLIYDYLKDDPADIVSALTPYTDYQYLQGFLLSCLGQAVPFLFDDFSDNVAGPPIFRNQLYCPVGYYVIDPSGHQQLVTTAGTTQRTGTPSWNDSGSSTVSGNCIFTDQGAFPGASAQLLSLVNDGAGNYYTPLQRNFGGQFLEDVTDLNVLTYPMRIWANGVLQTTANYTLMGPGLTIPGNSYLGMYLKWGSAPTTPITGAFKFYFRLKLTSDKQDIEQFMRLLWTIGGSKSKNGSGMLNMTTKRPNPV